jgi:hypothetical protein
VAALGVAARDPLDAATAPAVQPIARAVTATRPRERISNLVGRQRVGLGFMVGLPGLTTWTGIENV